MNEIPSQNPADDESLSGVLRSTFQKMLQRVEGMLPAMIVSYDRECNMATVKPLIQVLSTSGAGTSRAVLTAIPVLSLGGGGFTINFPLKPGDKGWIEASDRDISLFKQAQSEAKPNTLRLHSFSDGRFIPDVFGQYQISGEDESALVIQSADGETKIVLSETEIRITSPEAIKLKAAAAITLEAPQVTISAGSLAMNFTGGGDGNTTITAKNMAINADTITLNGTDWKTHRHTGVTPGGSNSGGVA